LVGRQKQLDTWDIAVKRISSGRTSRPPALYGLRGVGKTVLITRFSQMARRAGWMVAQIEATDGKPLRQLVADAFQSQIADLARPSSGKRAAAAIKTVLSFAKVSIDPTGAWTFGLDIQDSPGGAADTGILEADLAKVLFDLAGAAEEQNVGVALLVDEAQNLAVDELAALCEIQHKANQQEKRLLVVVAGLPSLPAKLAEAKSYAERLFDYFHVDRLSRSEAADALTEPAGDENVEWTADAVEMVLDAADGYPYFLQQFGNDTWNAADGSPLSVDAAKVGLTAGWLALDAGFFRSRWDRATPAEREYMSAMAQDGADGSSTSEIASRIGKKLGSLGPVRANLISKGMVYAPEHGKVAFTVPAMDRFILRQVV